MKINKIFILDKIPLYQVLLLKKFNLKIILENLSQNPNKVIIIKHFILPLSE
jgi:hypothetical protein